MPHLITHSKTANCNWVELVFEIVWPLLSMCCLLADIKLRCVSKVYICLYVLYVFVGVHGVYSLSIVICAFWCFLRYCLRRFNGGDFVEQYAEYVYDSSKLFWIKYVQLCGSYYLYEKNNVISLNSHKMHPSWKQFLFNLVTLKCDMLRNRDPYNN